MAFSFSQFGRKLENALIFRAMSAFGGFCRWQYLRQSRHAGKTSKKLLMRLVHKNRNTDFGRKHHFDAIHSVQDYQEKVPFTAYEDYQDYVERTAETGEQNLMTADPIVYFALTSGTLSLMKKIPVVKAAYIPILKCSSIFTWMMRRQLKKRGLGVMNCRGLNLIETSSVKTNSGIRSGYISGYAMGRMIPAITSFPGEIMHAGHDVDGKYLKALFSLADRDLAYLVSVFLSAITDIVIFIQEHHEMLIRDIETGAINASVNMPTELRKRLEKKLRPDPERAAELWTVFEHPQDGPLLPRIWRRLALVVGIGTGEFFPYVNKMRSFTGNQVAFCHAMYGSSEALFASCMREEESRYLLIPDGGFYEFLPLEGDTEKPKCLEELEDGKLYEIVVTNLSGLYRYRIKDVIRVDGFEGDAPYLRFAYRQQQVINIAGVHITAEQTDSAMQDLERALDNRIVDYSVYPDDGFVPARMIFFIEMENELNGETQSTVAGMLDRIFYEKNQDYQVLMEKKHLSPCKAYILSKNTYREYRRLKEESGKAVNQLKNVRVISNQEQLDFFVKAAGRLSM